MPSLLMRGSFKLPFRRGGGNAEGMGWLFFGNVP